MYVANGSRHPVRDLAHNFLLFLFSYILSANTSSNEKRHSVARGKRRSPNDVKLISKLPGDGCVTTWTATSSIDSSNETIFVARSITGEVSK